MYDNERFGSGTPTYLIETTPAVHHYPALSEWLPLTIKDHEPFAGLYTLGIPDKEIEVGLMRSLLPNYIKGMEGKACHSLLHSDKKN